METENRKVEESKSRNDGVPAAQAPVALVPLVDMHRRQGAETAIVDGWEVATRYPTEPREKGNAIVDLSHWATYEINGPQTGASLLAVFGTDVPLRTIAVREGYQIYRLTDRRSILFCTSSSISQSAIRDSQSALDVTGGWASIALLGPDAGTILSKVTAVDIRRETLPPGTCCQGPIFGVNTLFGRFDDRFELHVCSDSAEFFWEVLLDAGAEFDLKPAGVEFYKRMLA